MHRRLIILGSTGSIGRQALEVVAHLNTLSREGLSPVSFEVVGLAAGSNITLLAGQAAEYPKARTALACPAPGADFVTFTGPDSAQKLVVETEADLVLAAMVGVAGLPATLAAVEAGIDVALANKEALVAAGSLIIPAALRSGARLLPVDSEHAGVWQCLCCRAGAPTYPPPYDGGEESRGIAQITLTASGGPFRTWTKEQMRAATPSQARKHPTWTMGDKVTIDSASLMNKALELIEAHWLFGVGAGRLRAVIHPQSYVHALVEFTDSTTVAQLAPPDMRTPIHRALTFPHCAPSMSPRLDWSTLSSLTFEPVDAERFPAVNLALQIIAQTGQRPGLGAWFNAANEVAAAAFAAGTISFTDISHLVATALASAPPLQVHDLTGVLAADTAAREFTNALIAAR